jgi:prepilin-type N-terminal cleavage/methylation domain-containing protein
MNKKKKGMALLELIVAVAVMAMLIGGIMQGLNMTILGTYKDSRFNTALHLAQSQMEYVKEQRFDQVYPYIYEIIDDVPEGYDIELTIIPDYGHVTEEGVPIPGLQLVTVNVTCESNNVVLQEFKIHR